MSELKYWLWLTLKKELSNRTLTTLLDVFGAPENIFNADRDALVLVPGLTEKEKKAVLVKDLQKAYRVIGVCKKKNIKILTFDNPRYPRLLASIYDPPYVLYVRCREKIDLNNHATIAVVGTRKASSYGKLTTGALAKALAEGGMTIVSGMAEGDDASAAENALSAGGKTVAVLGCGVDICYPPSNRRLMKKIIDGGMVISEFPPGTPPAPWNFPKRNRIISGLSLGTVVTEAPKRSGALITARLAGEQNREVFTVPADITRKMSQGSNALLQDGAKPVLCAEDVLCEFREQYGDLLSQHQHLPVSGDGEVEMPVYENEPEEKTAVKAKVPSGITLSDTERQILALLSDRPVHVDRLAEQGVPVTELSSALIMLEMKGLVRALPGKQYILQL